MGSEGPGIEVSRDRGQDPAPLPSAQATPPPTSVLRRFAGDAFLYNLAAVVGSAVSILFVPLLTRLFTPELYGAANRALQVATTLSTLLILGMDSATARYYFDDEDPARRRRILSTGLAFVAAVGLAGTFITLAFSTPLTRLLTGSARNAAWLRISLAALPFLMLESYFRNVFRWRGERWRYFSLFVVGTNLRLLLSLGLAYSLGVSGLLLGSSLGVLLSACLGGLLAYRALGKEFEAAALPGMVRFGLPITGLGLAWPLTTLVDYAFLARFRPEWETGIYVGGLKLAALFTLLTEGLRQAWGPVAFSQWTRPSFPRLYSRIVHGYVLLSLLSACLMSLFAKGFAFVLLAPGYRQASNLLAALVGGLLAADLFNMLGIGLYYRKWSGRFALLAWLAVALAGVGNLFLVPALGALGAALANAGARFTFSCWHKEGCVSPIPGDRSGLLFCSCRPPGSPA